MTSIQMPQLGETIVEGTILKWLKAEGEQVERDEPLFEISTDKVDTEVPSPVAGTLTKIVVPEGETVPVGTELATIDDGVASTDGAATSGAATSPATAEPTLDDMPSSSCSVLTTSTARACRSRNVRGTVCPSSSCRSAVIIRCTSNRFAT